jgi:hypothetical protein
MRHSTISYAALLLSLALVAGCAIFGSGLPVRGTVSGQQLETRVDSEIARYYLSNYLAGIRGDRLLDARIDGAYRNSTGALPNRAELKRLSGEFSNDFAALFLADMIVRIPANRRLRDEFERARSAGGKAFKGARPRLPDGAGKYEVLLVPGYLYKRLPITGTDLAVPRAALKRVGFTCHFAETVEDGAVETNAGLVAAAIRARADTGRRLILISASKSAPEVAMALTQLGDEETRHVAAWINAVGALQGTPLTDERVLPNLEDKIGGVNAAGRESLTIARSRARFQSFRVPNHVLVVNYFGIPLTGSISSWGRRGHRHLKTHGPNDGILLLADMILPRALTLADLGRDHFLLDKRMDVTVIALTTTIIRWLEHDDMKASLIRGNESKPAGGATASRTE